MRKLPRGRLPTRHGSARKSKNARAKRQASSDKRKSPGRGQRIASGVRAGRRKSVWDH